MTYIRETRIKRSYQFQERDHDSVKRLLNTEKEKALKLKRQTVRNNMNVKRITKKVNKNSKQKRDRVAIEYKTSLEPSTLKQIKRERISLEVKNKKNYF